MNLKSIVTAFIFAAVPACLQAQQLLPNAPKPTKADAQRVIQIISGDKTKRERYCDLAKLDDQIEQANNVKDTKKAETLSQKLF